MRRIPLVLALTIGLVIGTMVPGSALGETSVTLNCSDGTSVQLLVDTDTLTNLTASVQAMLDYPAGLTCSLIKNPLGAFFGHIALADSAGTNPFIVGGGRWQLPCGPHAVVEGGAVARVPGGWSYPGAAPTPGFFWVNIAVNVHQSDGGAGPFFGSLNESIPEQSCGDPPVQVGESHFSSSPICLTAPATQTSPVFVTSRVTQVSGQVAFPGGVTVGTDTDPQYVHFGFQDNGNPPGQNSSVMSTTDMLSGPPAGGSDTNRNCVGPDPTFNLGAFPGSGDDKQYGNITVHLAR